MARKDPRKRARAAEEPAPEAATAEAVAAAAETAAAAEGDTSPAADEANEFDESLDELKELLAEEGVQLEDSPSPDAVLEELEAEPEERPAGGATREPSRRRPKRGAERERKARDAQAFRDLESQLSAHPLDINVSEDGLTAVLARFGEDDAPDDVLAELKRQKITVGIDMAAIEVAASRAAKGSVQYDVVVAQGTPAEVQEPAHVRYHLPEALSAIGGDAPLARLKQALSAPNLDGIISWEGPCHLVHKGELLAEVVPAQVVVGQSVRGEEIAPAEGEVPELPQAEHILLSEDGSRCMAGAYGYAGILEDGPSVVLPLWVSPDNMEARFVCLQDGAPAPSEGELSELLKARWIEHGVQEESLVRIRQALELGKPLPPAALVAQGTRPVAGTPGQVQCLVPPQQLPDSKQLQSLLKLRERAGLEEGVAELTNPERATALRAVGPGDAVAELVPAREGTPGRDVLGEEIEADEVEEVELAVGDNVALDEDGRRARATCFGYLALYGSAQMSVVSPLWLSGDRMTLGYLNLPQGEAARYPSNEELDQLVKEDGHLQGADTGAWEEVLPRLESGELTDPLVVIAEGTPAEAGREDTFEWAVTVGGRAGTILEDGSIDLRDRQLITVVEEGGLLGRFTPGAPGQPGRDVLGHELNPPALTQLEVVGDSRINAVPEGDEGVMGYYAASEGGVTFTEESRQSRGAQRKRIRLSLFAISEIDGDVDYNVGHVDFQGEVLIKGTVRALFRVKASGSVTIGENVEPGARVEAGGDILVSGGVVGQATELVAGGNVMAKFVQEAQVRAGGDVEVGAYIHEASVRAGGVIKVAGAGEGGGRALVGGMVWAVKGIEAPSLGSPSNPRIRLVAGIDPSLVEQTEEVRGKIRACEALEREVLSALNLRQLDVRVIKQRAKNLEGAKRDELLAQAARLAEYTDLHHHLHARLRQVAKAQRELARQATVAVGGPVVAGAELRIGEYLLKVTEDGANLKFHLAEENGQVHLQADGL